MECAFGFVEEHGEQIRKFIEWFSENSGMVVASEYEGKDVEDFRNGINKYKE